MRRSTLYILILAAAAIVASALAPQMIARYAEAHYATDSDSTTDTERSIELAPGRLPSSISVEGDGCSTLMIQVGDDDGDAVSVTASHRRGDFTLRFDEATGTLVIAPANKGGRLPKMLSVTLTPDCRLSSIGGLDADATVALDGLSTPVLAIGHCPATMLISDCAIGQLVIGPKGGDDSADLSLADSRIDTLVSAVPMGRVNISTSDTEIGLSTFATR